MRIIEPIQITSSVLIASNIVDDLPRGVSGVTYSLWNSATAYADGNIVCWSFTATQPFIIGANEFIAGSYDVTDNAYPPGTYFGLFTASISGGGSIINKEPSKKTYKFGSSTYPGAYWWRLTKVYPVYNADTTFGSRDTVGHISGATGAIYQSLIANNKGNTPPSSATSWKQTTENSYNTWSGGATYGVGDTVAVFAGQLGTVFISLQAGNLNNAPDSSPTYWRYVGQAYKEYNPATAYVTGDVISVPTTHSDYEALQASTGKDPTDQATNAAYWLELGKSNRWRMFDSSNSSASTNGESIENLIETPTNCDSVVLMGIKGKTVNISVTALAASNLNLLDYTEAFDNAAWTKTGGAITADFAYSPTGTLTADKFTAAAGYGAHNISRPGLTYSGDHNWAIYAKKDNNRWAFISADGVSFNYFDFDDEVWGSNPDNCSAVRVGDGWWRFTHPRNMPGGTFAGCQIGVADADGGAIFTALGTEAILLWGAHLMTGASAAVYQAVDAAYTGRKLVYCAAFDLADESFITDWRHWFFDPIRNKARLIVNDLPIYGGAQIRVVVQNIGEVASVDSQIIGLSEIIGSTLYGFETGIIDYSKVAADDFGGRQLVVRDYADRGTIKVLVKNSQLPAIKDRLAELRATPIVCQGTDDLATTWISGIIKDFSIPTEAKEFSELSLQMEGLA